MEAPPNYSPAPKKSNTGLIIGIVIGSIALCCLIGVGGVAGLGFFGYNKVKGTVTCSIGFKQIRDATLAYAKAHKGVLPNAKTWMDDVRPFYDKEVAKSKEQPFGHIPVEGVWACTEETGKSGIAFNASLSGKALASIKDPSKTTLIFETEETGLNLAKPYKALPKESSPKIMGKPRGWMSAPVEGPIFSGTSQFDVEPNGGPVQVDTN